MLGTKIYKSTDNILLYAAADERFKQDIESHLRLLFNEERLVSIKAIEVTKYYPFKEELSKNLEKTTSVICLVSHTFIASAFGLSIAFQKMMEAHRTQKTKIIPILLDQCDLSKSVFKSSDLLPSNKEPILHFFHDKDYHAKLGRLMKEVHTLYQAANHFEERQERTWKRVVNEDSISSYSRFLNLYGHSKYVKPAWSQKNHLKDEQLWNNAKGLNRIDLYVEYLSSDVPNKKHQEKAIAKIIEIEETESYHREDMEKSDNPGLLFYYKTRFRKKGALDFVNKKLTNLFMNKRLENWFNEQGEIEVQADYLKWKIYEQCSPKETITFHWMEEAIKSLYLNFLVQQKKFRAKRGNIFWVLRMLFLVLPLFLIPFYFLIDDLFHVLSVWFTKFVPLLSISAGLVVFTSTIYWLLRGFKKDEQACAKKAKATRKLYVLMKIAFLTHDPIKKAQVLFKLNNLEESFQSLSEKGLVDYFMDEPEVDKEEKSRKQKIENKIHGL